jgi:hypothetical protein
MYTPIRIGPHTVYNIATACVDCLSFHSAEEVAIIGYEALFDQVGIINFFLTMALTKIEQPE